MRCHVEVVAAEYPVDIERARRFERAQHGFGCCTHNLQVRYAAFLPDAIRELPHRGKGHAHVLETDMANAQLDGGIYEPSRVLDRPIAAGQHEDEIHGAP